MESTPPSGAAPDDLNPLTSDPRVLMQALLPAARRQYVKAWETLADTSTPLEVRRAGRDRARAVAEDHGIVAAALRGREGSLQGDDLLNARHLAGELERHAAALERLATVPPLGLASSADLRPEALGCGRRYRDPSRTAEAAAGTRGVPDRPKSNERGRGRGGRPGEAPGHGGRSGGSTDRGPKVPRDALGTSKHDSSVGDDLDEATRAKLEAMRRALEN